PTDRPRPRVQSYRGAKQPLTLPTSLSEELKALSQRENVTLFMSLLAGFQVLLSRYTGQSEIVVGTTSANRPRSETEALIGFFINTLALRTSVRAEQSWQRLLHQVREVCLGAYAHQELPFEKLVDELQPERALSYQPLFQVLMTLQNAPRQELRLRGLSLSRLHGETTSTKFDLTLTLEESGGALRGSIGYNTDLFEAETIRRMAGHYERLLESLVGNSGQALWQVQMLSVAEQQQIVSEWNQTRREYPEKCQHELFEEQVRQRAEATAVRFGGEEL